MSLVLFIAMTVCLYGATFVDGSFGTKMCLGIAAAFFYVVINLIPFFLRRRKDAELSLKAYLKTYINEIITEE